ncbi:MAG: GntR family transcriptional regulator [Actinobacteria bacterium]|nr:GntR family transcriptional regulator [Actinomycetota bacterium]
MPHIPALLVAGTESGLDRTNRAYQEIRRQIIEMTLPPGSRFTEASLAKQWQISKTPVREALARLRRDGLVDALPRAGYLVSPITLDDTDDLCRLRTLVSGEAAAEAAARGPAAPVLDRLELLSKVPFAYSKGKVDREEALSAAFEFEAIMANSAGNGRLAKTIVEVLDELERVLRMVWLIAPETASPPAEQEAIFAQLRKGDPDGARQAMRDRCERVRHDILQTLAKTASVSRAHIEIPAL